MAGCIKTKCNLTAIFTERKDCSLMPSFPLKIMEELTQKVFEKYGAGALQYDLTEGFLPLREVLVDFLLKRN